MHVGGPDIVKLMQKLLNCIFTFVIFNIAEQFSLSHELL